MFGTGAVPAAAPAAVAARLSQRVLVAVAGLWLAMSFTYPFGWDQGILSWAGHVVLRGGMPYRDAWDMKGPVAYQVFALTEAIFGVHLWSIRVVDAALLLLATASVARASAALADRLVARWSAIVFFLWYASHSYWHTAQPDGWVAMAMAIVVLGTVIEETPTRRRLIACGVCVGTMSLVKPIYVMFLVLPLMFAVDRRRRSRGADAALVILGAVLPVGVCAAWFAAHNDLAELWAIYIRYPATVYNEVATPSVLTRMEGLVRYVLQAPVIGVGLPIVVLGSLALWQTRPRTASVLVTWAVLSVFLVVLQGRFFAYHWLPLLPAFVVLGAVGARVVVDRIRMLAVASLVVILTGCIAPIAIEQFRFLLWIAGRIDTATYYDGYGEPGSEMRAVEWLRTKGADGKVFVFGWNTGVAWLSHREIVSRFGFSMPLLLGGSVNLRSAYQAELLGALRADIPRYIIVGVQSQRILGWSAATSDFPALANFVQSGYSEVAHFGEIQLFERTAARENESR